MEIRRQGLRPLPLAQIKNGTQSILASPEKAFIVFVYLRKARVASNPGRVLCVNHRGNCYVRALAREKWTPQLEP